MTSRSLPEPTNLRRSAIRELFTFEDPERESITGVERWYNTTGEPNGIFHYTYRDLEDGVGFRLSKPEADHGFQVAKFVDGITDDHWVAELDFRVTNDGMAVGYEDPEGTWRVNPVRESEQTSVVLFASEALTHGADHS
jgi:hypothetical protein